MGLFDIERVKMTRETRNDAIEFFKKVAEKEFGIPKYSGLALEALKQMPCEDAISRQAVIDVIESMSNANPSYWNTCNVVDRGNLIDEIMELPSVTPQPKTGHWEHGGELSRVFIGGVLKGINYEDWHCSNCHCVVEQSIKPKWSYCPNCGAKMVEPQESEVENDT